MAGCALRRPGIGATKPFQDAPPPAIPKHQTNCFRMPELLAKRQSYWDWRDGPLSAMSAIALYG